MKKQNILLAGLLFSSSTVLAQDQVNVGTIKPADLQTFSQIAQYQHRRATTSIITPKPPRLVSPNEFQRLQSKIISSHQHFTFKEEPSKKIQRMKKSVNIQVMSAAVAGEGCVDVSDLLSLSGEALVTSIAQGNLAGCLYGLYNEGYAGADVFSDANVLTVAQAINDALLTFTGTNESGAVEIEKLVTYLRAMHWVESSTGRIFEGEYKAELDQAFTRYFNGDHFVTFNGEDSRNFMIRFEMLILVNSSDTNRQPYLTRFSEALLGYANTVDRSNDWGVYYEEQGLTNLLVQFFNANTYEETAFENTLNTNPEIIDNLISFITNDASWLVGHTREYQWSDTISELGRLLKFSGEIADQVRPAIANILSTYSVEGVGSSGWINAQSMVKFYDTDNCEVYGDACSFDLEEYVLSGNHACSATVKIRYQGIISNENITATCNILTAGQEKFHQVFDTNPATPVANDFNEALEVVLFSSSSDYQSFAGDFFGINTDNGGMYLEGNPFSEASQARFIAYQAEWLPAFTIWNLEHEQYHYLDGRFNQWGSFSDQPVNSVWWGEGIAEYLAQPNNNANALSVAPQNTYSLSELFETTYANSDSSRTYAWGYLAARFMMENHREEIDNELLPSMRAIKYDASGGGDQSNEGCTFDWSWKAKPEAEENNWLWAYDDSENGSGYWVWTCGQLNTGVPEEEEPSDPLPEFTPYQDVLTNWGSRFDDEFNEWLSCIVAGEGVCTPSITNPADLDGNNQIDKRDLILFAKLLRNSTKLGLEYDFNNDLVVNRRDLKAMIALCDSSRCAIAL